MLSPKPERLNRPKKDWSHLDGILKNKFQNSYHDKPSLIILVDEYDMTAEEIKREAEKKGYTVTLSDENRVIKFE